MKNIIITVGISCVIALTPCRAAVITDGTLGNKVHLQGNMIIDQRLGKINGGNLFHSFKVFDINKGQKATFTDSGNHAIKNIISRVTGHRPSIINGTLEVDKTTMPKAAFYFINPNGVVFGEDASVDVPGAFHVSTADNISFGHGKVFSATQPDTASSLVASKPESFGFLGHQKGSIRVNGTTLEFKPNSRVSFSGRNLFINNSNIINKGIPLYTSLKIGYATKFC